jgi:hypothetical protein
METLILALTSLEREFLVDALLTPVEPLKYGGSVPNLAKSAIDKMKMTDD